MGCGCSKIPLCAVCNEPCQTYVCALKSSNPSVRVTCCIGCASSMRSKLDDTGSAS